MADNPLTRQQQRIVLILWLTYALFYLGRVNLSAAIPDLADALDVSRAEVGLLGTVWLWVYALGQIINGQLGNRYSPRRLVAVGIVVVAVCNLAFGFQDSLLAMAVIWGVDGYAFSLGWGPILRILAENLSSSQRLRISTLFPMNIPVGAAMTWAVVGIWVAVGGWEWAFWGSGLALLGLLAGWWLSGVNAPPSQTTAPAFRLSQITDELIQLAPAFIISGFVGLVLLSALTWIPSYVKDTGLFDAAVSGVMSGVLSLMGIPGILLATYLMERLKRVLLTLCVLLGVGALFLFLSLVPVTELQLVFVGAVMMVLWGAMGMVLSVVPILMAGEGRASSAAGLATAIFSISGGLGTVATGALVDAYNWETVFGIGGVFILIAAGLAWLSQGRES